MRIGVGNVLDIGAQWCGLTVTPVVAGFLRCQSRCRKYIIVLYVNPEQIDDTTHAMETPIARILSLNDFLGKAQLLPVAHSVANSRCMAELHRYWQWLLSSSSGCIERPGSHAMSQAFKEYMHGSIQKQNSDYNLPPIIPTRTPRSSSSKRARSPSTAFATPRPLRPRVERPNAAAMSSKDILHARLQELLQITERNLKSVTSELTGVRQRHGDEQLDYRTDHKSELRRLATVIDNGNKTLVTQQGTFLAHMKDDRVALQQTFTHMGQDMLCVQQGIAKGIERREESYNVLLQASIAREDAATKREEAAAAMNATLARSIADEKVERKYVYVTAYSVSQHTHAHQGDIG